MAKMWFIWERVFKRLKPFITGFLVNICLLFTSTASGFSHKYEINVSLKSKNDTVYLGHYFAKSDVLISDDTLILKNGKGVFKGNKELTKGIYFLLNDHKKYDFIIGDHRQFGIVADTVDILNNIRFANSPENDIFYQFQRYNAHRNAQIGLLNEQWKNATDTGEKDRIYHEIQALNNEGLAFARDLIDKSKGMYVSKLLNAILPIEIPDPPATVPQDSLNLYKYRWYRAHFFDNLDIYDPDMLRTPFYEGKIMEYLTKWVPQLADTISVEIDKILVKAQSNGEIFHYILATLYNYYATPKLTIDENVWVYIVEKWHIPFATWSTEENKEKLKEEIKKRKPNLVGNEAPPMEWLMVLPTEHFKAAALDTAIKNDVHAGENMEDFRKSIKARFVALIFWDYSCGHCKKAIQDLYQVHEAYKNKGLQVLAIQTVASREAKEKWIDFINEHDLFDWINAWKPYSNQWRDHYNVYKTPLIYLLDEKKRIIIKDTSPEQVKEIIDRAPDI